MPPREARDRHAGAARRGRRRRSRRGSTRSSSRSRRPNAELSGDPGRSQLERSDLRRDTATAAGRSGSRRPRSTRRRDVLTSRPGLSGVSGLSSLTTATAIPRILDECTRRQCSPNPLIQEIGALPSGTSAPNTVITEHAMKEYPHRGRPPATGWCRGPTLHRRPDQQRQLTASTSQLSVESRNDSRPPFDHRQLGRRLFGILIALGVLGDVGRARAQRDLRRTAHAGGDGCVELHTAHADGGDGRCAGLPRRAPRGGRRLHRHDRLAAEQLAERRDLRARERSRRATSSSSSSACRSSRRSWDGCSPVASPPSWDVNRLSKRSDARAGVRRRPHRA